MEKSNPIGTSAKSIQQINDLNYIPYAQFPTDNEFDIPCLDINMQAKMVEIPFVIFGELKRTFNMMGKGTLHFYTDDYRFAGVFKNPEYILRCNPSSIIEPNYSLADDMALAFGLQAIYKKRLLARYCQEYGIRVFADLNVPEKFLKYNMLGIPKGWSSFATRSYSQNPNWLEVQYQLARYWAGDNKLTFVVYGGGEEAKKFCYKNGCVYMQPYVSTKTKNKKTIDATLKAIATGKVSEKEGMNLLYSESNRRLFEEQKFDFQNVARIGNGEETLKIDK